MSKHSNQRGRREPMLNEEPPKELDFGKDDGRSGRAGDPRTPRDVAEEFPKAREQQAGMTGGELGDGGITADDLAPETLLDEDRSHSPAAKNRRAAADTVLREVDGSEIGGGGGRDEAELTEDDPAGRR